MIRHAPRSSPVPRTRPPSVQSMRHSQGRLDTYYYHYPPIEASPASHMEHESMDKMEETYPAPPQTVHYWTSDHTRRLEYAAIDSATQGLRGWLVKHLVPNCFVPQKHRRLRFDDDTGSVRRYRLDLDGGDMTGKDATEGRKMGWLVGK